MKRKRTVWVALVALLLGIVIGALGYGLFLQPKEAAVKNAEVITAEGVLLPEVRRYTR